jgi:hypothetical protein
MAPVPQCSNPNNTVQNIPIRSPRSQFLKPTFARSHNVELPQGLSNHPPRNSHFPVSPLSRKSNGGTDIWRDSLGSYCDSQDNINLNSWLTRQSSTGDALMGGCTTNSLHHSRPIPPWAGTTTQYTHNGSLAQDHRPAKEKDQQVVVTLRDDQLGQIIEVLSPPKSSRNLPHGHGCQHDGYTGRRPTAHAYYPPRMDNLPRPSSIALARKSSYTNLNTTSQHPMNKPSLGNLNTFEPPKHKPFTMFHPWASSNKENLSPSQSRLPTPFPYANRVLTPNLFAPRIPRCDLDISMRDTNSVFSSFSHLDGTGLPMLYGATLKQTAAYTPSMTGGVKSRKEGLARSSTSLTEHDVRHDRSLLPPTGLESTLRCLSATENASATHGTPIVPTRSTPKMVEIIDVDAIVPGLEASPRKVETRKLSPFKTHHKSGMSSIDSTGRLERQLFSALGEELGSYDPPVDTTSMAPPPARGLTGSVAHADLSGSTTRTAGASDSEVAGKRKRQIVEEQNGNPMSKREKGGEVDEVGEQAMPRLRSND